jgi:transposase
MARRPSADFRERLVAAIDAGLPPGEAARLFRVHVRTVYRWLARRRGGEGLAERPRSGRPPKLGPERHPVLRALVAAHPDATLPEHAARLEAATGVRLSPAHLSRRRRRPGLPLKKNPRSPPSATRTPAPRGGRRWPPSTRPTSCSSTRRAPRSR